MEQDQDGWSHHLSFRKTEHYIQISTDRKYDDNAV